MNANVSGIGARVQAAATMDGRYGVPKKATPMRLAVLATIIDQPGWRYDIATRFNRKFGRALSVTDRRIYQIVDGLQADGLIEVLAPPRTDPGSRPLLHYGATPLGERTYLAWLSQGMEQDPDRVAMQVTILAENSRDRMLAWLDVHERRILRAIDRLKPARAGASLGERLGVLHEQMMLNGKLDFIRAARQEIEREP